MPDSFEAGEAQTIPALQELQAHPQWVCWRMVQRCEKATKVPYNPRTGRPARADDPATWATYQEALDAFSRDMPPYQGLGYVFDAGQGITGIDLDQCVSASGQLSPWAMHIVARLASYTEYSPGHGLHILVRGRVPKGIRRFIPADQQPDHPEAALEMYSSGRYFTITGRHLPIAPRTLEARQAALDALYAEYGGMDTTGEAATPEPPGGSGPALDDEGLLEKACSAADGEKFRRLFYNGPAGYPSASEADFALCVLLAFWTGRDTERIDRLFRQSACYREKWNSPRGKSTYGRETIRKAVAACQVIYDPSHTAEELKEDLEQLAAPDYPNVGGPARRGTKRKGPNLSPKELDTRRVLAYLGENEYGDARFFAAAFANQVCYDSTCKEWYVWAGHFWQKDTTGQIRQLVSGDLASLYLHAAADLNSAHAEADLKMRTLLESGARESDAEIRQLKESYSAIGQEIKALRDRAWSLRSAKRCKNVMEYIQVAMGITSDQWDTNQWALATPSGVLDLHSGTIRPGQPTDFIRTVCPTPWTGLHTPCPRFERFLQEIFEDKPDRDELIAYLQRLFGYGITGMTTDHVFPILYGEDGRNGKDTLLGTLEAVLGPLVGAVSNDVFLTPERFRGGGAATPHLCDLQGKRLVWGSETKQGDKLNIAQIKLLTGGGAISARPLYGKQYSFTPTHKLVLMTNYKPHADARDKAFWARACLITFGMRFVEEPKAENERRADPTLKAELLAERSGILAWLVRGCLQWQEMGLQIPSSVRLETSKYREEEDRLALFIEERCLVAPHASVGADALYSAYKDWCKQNNLSALTGTAFGRDMGKRFEKTRGKQGNIYQGIGLLDAEERSEAELDAFAQAPVQEPAPPPVSREYREYHEL